MTWLPEPVRRAIAPPTPFTSQNIVARHEVVVVERCSLPHTCPECGTSWEPGQCGSSEART